MNHFNNGDKVYTSGDIDRLEQENKRLESLLESKTEIANQLKDNLTAAFERELQLKAQLVEVNNNRTGVSPCAKFCEALAAKKMFDSLQQENSGLKAKIAELQNSVLAQRLADLTRKNLELMARVSHWEKEYSDECRKHINLHNQVYSGEFGDMPEGSILNSEVIIKESLQIVDEEFTEEYANQLRQQANPFEKVNKARDEAKAALFRWIEEVGE